MTLILNTVSVYVWLAPYLPQTLWLKAKASILIAFPARSINTITNLKMNNDSKVYKVLRRVKTLRCDRCPPNRNENRKRAPRRSWKFTNRKAAQHNG